MEIKGFTYGYDAWRGDYNSAEGIKSQELLFQTGINYMCLAVPMMLKDAHSCGIKFDYSRSITDLDIIKTVIRAHENGVKVCLKPMVNCEDGVWRARISFPDMGEGEADIYWDAWFADYTGFITHYAEIAEYTECEMLCIGCEMCETERKSSHWKQLIKKVREVYSGIVVYNTNHGHEEAVEWFTDVDCIGTSAYFTVGLNGISKEGMVKGWQKVKDEMCAVHERFGKDICFMEIGCRSADTCSTMPWDFEHTQLSHNEEEQALFYDSCLSVFADVEWFRGMFWWDWSTFIYDTAKEAAEDNGFNIHLKEAEQVIKDYYAKL